MFGFPRLGGTLKTISYMLRSDHCRLGAEKQLRKVKVDGGGGMQANTNTARK